MPCPCQNRGMEIKTFTSPTAGAQKSAARKQARATACNLQFGTREEKFVPTLSKRVFRVIGTLAHAVIEASDGIKHTLAHIARPLGWPVLNANSAVNPKITPTFLRPTCLFGRA